MAIIFARLDPIHLTPRSWAARLIAYTGRTIVADRGLLHDYRHLADGLVHEEVMLPPDYPAEFDIPSILAAALDRAELQKVRTRLEDRDRLPQVGLHLTLALPPDDEVSLHEAQEIMRRVIDAARGSRPLAAYFAIHDHKRNRHGHGVLALRVYDANGIAGSKELDLIARIRSTAVEMKVVEGRRSPGKSNSFSSSNSASTSSWIRPRRCPGCICRQLSTEWEWNLRPSTRRDKAYETTRSANIAAIEGSPTALIETMLRGRFDLHVKEIEQLSAKFFDSKVSQQVQVDRIFSDQNVIMLTDTSSADGPGYVTTRRVHRLVARAVTLVENSSPGTISAITGAHHTSVVEQISELCALSCREPLILGQSLSDCSATKAALAAYQPVVSTVDMAITGSPDLREKGRNRGARLRQDRLVVVPHAERIDDPRLVV